MLAKRCTKCGEEKPLANFSPDSTHKDGFRSQCKQCTAARARQWRSTHPEVVSEVNRINRQRHLEARRETDRLYYQEHGEAQRSQKRHHYQDHRKDVLKRNSDWVKRNPIQKRASNHRHRTRKLGAEGHYTAADVERQREAQKGCCYYCGEKAKLTVDHIVPLSRGGSNWPENIVLACGSCNSSKRDRLPHEWPEGGRLL